MKGRDRVNSERWIQARANGSSPWCGTVPPPQGNGAVEAMRLIAARAVKAKLAPQVGRETIRITGEET